MDIIKDPSILDIGSGYELEIWIRTAQKYPNQGHQPSTNLHGGGLVELGGEGVGGGVGVAPVSNADLHLLFTSIILINIGLLPIRFRPILTQ